MAESKIALTRTPFGFEGRLEHALVSKFYGDRTAERSGVPLMNHINEGLIVLQWIDADIATLRAWCLHPLVQRDEDLAANYNRLRDLWLAENMDPAVLMLAMEYRNQANAWLSDKVSLVWGADGATARLAWRPKLAGAPSTGPLTGVKHMLIADKVQNYKDFRTYHSKSHERAQELEAYFEKWLQVLGVTEQEYKRLCQRIDQHKGESA